MKHEGHGDEIQYPRAVFILYLFYCSMAVMLNNSKFKHLDGVTTVRYKLHIRIKQPLFTRIIVSFPGPTEPEYAKKHFLQKTKQLKFLSVNFHRNSRNVMLWRERVLDNTKTLIQRHNAVWNFKYPFGPSYTIH